MGLTFSDATFLDSKLYLIDPTGANTQLRVLGSDYSILRTSVHPGAPVRVFPWNGKLLLLTRASSKTSVRQLDP